MATQTAIAHSDMQRLETEHLVLYYPKEARDETLRIASRYEACLGRLRAAAHIHGGNVDEKARIVLPPTPLNNAYVAPAAGGVEAFGVVPTVTTAEVFEVLGIPPDPSFIGCHELTHWVQSHQNAGVPKLVNDVFGSIYTPQIGLDSWFWEGLAVYYETKLQGGVGRLGSPYWHGLFAAGVAGKKPNGGWLHELSREVPYGANYLVGSHFIDYLARTYGEERLWTVVTNQGDSILFPFGVNPRFGNVYPKDLSGLIDDFAAETMRRYPVKARPDGQKELRSLESYARTTCEPEGREAEIVSGLDSPTRLVVRGANGDPVFEENLTDVLPGRHILDASALMVSGLSFTKDGNYLYFTIVDQGDIAQVAKLARVDLAAKRVEIVYPDLGGVGGSVSPDGRTYYFSRAHGDRFELAAFEIDTKTPHYLDDLGPRVYPTAPRVSPDGKRLAATVFDGQSFRIMLFDARDGRRLGELPRGQGEITDVGAEDTTPVVTPRKTEAWELDPSWQDDGHVLYAAESEGRMQIFRADLGAGTTTRVTSAPYLATNPCAARGHVRFMNRIGWSWTLDEIAIDSGTPAAPLPFPARGLPGGPLPTDDATPKVLADERYSHLDHIWFPQSRGAGVTSLGDTGVVISAAASGGDRLGFHKWGLGFDYNVKTTLPNARVAYLTAELAPWHIGAELSTTASRENLTLPAPSAGFDYTSRENTAQVKVTRPFFTNEISFGVNGDALERTGFRTLRAAGPFVGATYAAVESTPYSGARRGIVATARGAFYPSAISGRSSEVGDVRGQIVGYLPVPFLRRPTIALSARTRQLVGVPSTDGFLQVGGGGATGVHAQDGTGDARVALDDPRAIDLPPTIRFYEPLFGFEDRPFFVARMGAADARLRIPIVTDVGTASSFWLFPSFFLRGFALEGFGTLATFFDGAKLPASAGGAAIAQLALWRLPLALRVHVARRLTIDPHWVPYFGLDSTF